MKKAVLASAIVLAAIFSVSAQETPLWLRKSCISPDGTTIAFSYKGDIWTVPATGGNASQITSNAAYDSDPIWTPDSRQLVFTSYREGSKDIFVTRAEGGVPKRLTNLPGNETPYAVRKDGTVLFGWYEQNLLSDRFNGFPGTSQLYETDLEGKTPRLVTSLPVMALSVAADGTLLYEDYKGYEDPLRKHHTSSVTRDIWLFKGDKPFSPSGQFTKLTSYAGEDRNPVFAADGKTFYYLSEEGGRTINVRRGSITSPGVSVQLTFESRNPVRFLSVSDNGTLAFSLNGELYTLRDGGTPKKVEISIFRDEAEPDMVRRNVASGVSSMAVSPNGKEIAIVVRGDVFVTSVDYKTTRRITNTPEQERDVDFSKDGRELYYSAERNGNWGVWRTVLTEKEDKLFTYAVKMKEELVSAPGETCFQPDVAPDGKSVAYYRDRTELVVKDLKSGKEKSLFKNVNYSYSDGDQGFEWSPDSRFILCNWQADGGWNNSDIALVEIETGKITNLTESGYSDGGFQWALKGKAMTFESDKNGYRSHGSWGAESDIYIMFFDGKALSEFGRSKEEEAIAEMQKTDKEKKAEEKKEKKEEKDSLAGKEPKVENLVLDLEHREDRVKRLTRSSNRIGNHFLSPDGKKLYFTQPLERGMDLCVLDIQEGNITVLKKGVNGRIVPSEDGKYLYVSSGTGISRIAVPGGKTDNIAFSGDFEWKPSAERTYMFEHVWKQVKEKFYDPNLHGVDWDYYHTNYAQFLPHINNNFDFQDLLSEMLGELNGSHTGGRYRPASTLNMGCLGVLFDPEYDGEGLRFKEILPNGVINLADPDIKAGDLLVAIEGTPVRAGDDWFSLLANTVGKQIAVTVKKGGKDVSLFVRPTASDATLLYRRWVKQREEMVERLSGGKVGYVHIQSMNSPSFRELYSKALGKYRACEALIVDTRHNGGGWLHDDLVTFLGGKEYCLFTPRGQYIGHEPFNKWTKPSCVLIGEDNYSDASGFPYAYRSLGIGKLIGAPVPGTMTAVWWETLIDNTLIFGIPQVGNWAVDAGRYLENFPIEPDILVYNDPASVLNGEDKQLERAVAEMLQEIEKNK